MATRSLIQPKIRCSPGIPCAAALVSGEQSVTETWSGRDRALFPESLLQPLSSKARATITRDTDKPNRDIFALLHYIWIQKPDGALYEYLLFAHLNWPPYTALV